MMTWFTPTISPGIAEGTSTRQVIWRCVQPIIRPSSRTSCGTAASASMATRVIGGRA